MAKPVLRYLTPRHETQRQRPRATFDLEANSWTDFEMIGFFDGETYLDFKTMEAFFEHVFCRRYRNWQFYAHYGGKYDFQFVLEIIRTKFKEHQYSIVTQGAKAIKITIRTKGMKWHLCDSSALFPNTKLEKLCESFNTNTKKIVGAIDFEGGERADWNNPLHREYMKNDCISLYEVLDSFSKIPIIAKEGLNLTIASQAMNTWRHTLKHTIKVNPNRVSDLVRESYVGGRVEIFKMKGSGLGYYDVTSLFPYAMRSKRLPVQWKARTRELTDNLSFLDVSIKAPEMYIPILPVKREEKLIFPTGRFRGVFFSEELKLALKHGYVIEEVHAGEEFFESTDLFTEYIDELFQIKNSAPKGSALEYTAKLLLNSLYGKYGQKPYSSCLKTIDDEVIDKIAVKVFHSPEMFEKTRLIMKTEYNPRPHMLPQIAAATTSYSRIHMAERFYLPNPASCFYTDTDSILSSIPLPVGNNLGDLKLVYPDKLDCTFKRPKGYDLSVNGQMLERKMKGFPKKFIESLTYEQFDQLDFEYRQEIFATMKRSLISSGKFVSRIEVKKSIKGQYTKRRMLQNGETEPWIIKNNEIINKN